MLKQCNLLNFYAILILIAVVNFNCRILAIDCYECSSTFAVNSICLPECSRSYEENSTCLLTRNIPLQMTSTGSLQAGHIHQEPIISTAKEKNFVFGEEAAFLEFDGWNWEYGSITYGCDTS